MRNLRYFFLFSSLFFVVFSTGCVPETYQYSSEFGKAGSAKGEFLGPTDMLTTKSGDLLIADSGNNRIQIVGIDGTPKLAIGEYGTTWFKFQGISGLGQNRLSGEIAVCDLRGSKIVKFDANGTPLLRFTERVKCPIDVDFDKIGNMYVIMAKQPYIFMYDVVGRFQKTIGGKGKAAFIFPSSILINDETIYVADFGSKRIVKMNMNGDVQAEITQKGEFEPLKGPSGMFFDPSQNSFLLDLGEVPVVMLAPDGALISKIGSFGKEPGQFLYPKGIAAKDTGEVFVLDNSRNVVIVFKKAPGK